MVTKLMAFEEEKDDDDDKNNNSFQRSVLFIYKQTSQFFFVSNCNLKKKIIFMSMQFLNIDSNAWFENKHYLKAENNSKWF